MRPHHATAPWPGRAGIHVGAKLSLTAGWPAVRRSCYGVTALRHYGVARAGRRAWAVPVRTMPWWLRGFAQHQPATPVTETIRGLLLRQPGGIPLGSALAWCGGMLAVSVALSALLFRRRTA